MKDEIKKITPEVIKVFNDFMNSLSEIEAGEDYLSRKYLKSFVLDLILEENPIFKLSRTQDRTGTYVLTPIHKRIYKRIERIKELDIWDIEEEPDNEHLTVKFKRKDCEETE